MLHQHDLRQSLAKSSTEAGIERVRGVGGTIFLPAPNLNMTDHRKGNANNGFAQADRKRCRDNSIEIEEWRGSENLGAI